MKQKNEMEKMSEEEKREYGIGMHEDTHPHLGKMLAGIQSSKLGKRPRFSKKDKVKA